MPAGKRITELPAAAELQPSDLLVIARGRRNYQVPAWMLTGQAPSSLRGGFSFSWRQDGGYGPPLADSASGLFRWSGPNPASAYAVWIHRQAQGGLDTASFWQAAPDSFLLVTAPDGSAALFDVQAVSASGQAFRVDLAHVSGQIAPSEGGLFHFSPMPRPASAALICGQPTASAAPADGEALVYDAQAGLWRPSPFPLRLMRYSIHWLHPSFRQAVPSFSVPVGILPAKGKVLGISASFQQSFTGVPGVEASLGWQNDMEAYMSFRPAAAGTHDVAGFISATDAQHELRLYFRASQPFGTGTATLLNGGMLELALAWVSI